MDIWDMLEKNLSAPMISALSRYQRNWFLALEEIRIRANGPVAIRRNNKEYFLSADGQLQETKDGAYVAGQKELWMTVERFGNYSLYSLEEERRNGFFTVEGGHRIGLCGQAVVEDGALKTIRDISAVNIRFAHERIGCADEMMEMLTEKGRVLHTLIVSPPGCGKTTLLRDMIRQISGVWNQTVGVVDERSEIAGCFRGLAQNDVGPRTDVLDRCPKDVGILLLLRSMSPKVIAVDEIGGDRDVQAILEGRNAGVTLLCTAHGATLEDLQMRPALKVLLKEHVFERYLFLTPSRQYTICSQQGKAIKEGALC